MQIAPLYESIAHLLTAIFARVPCGSVFDVAKSLLVLFAHSDELRNVSANLFHNLSEGTLRFCGNTGADGNHEHPDVLSEYFAFLAQVSTL